MQPRTLRCITSPLPAELVEALADRLVAAARDAVLGVHADALPDGVEAAVEVVAGHALDAVSSAHSWRTLSGVLNENV